MNLEERIQAGLDGKFQGLSNGFKRINSEIHGIQRGVYTLLGGLSGTYKTTLADYMLLNALSDAESQGLEINVFYYSYEIDELSKKCNWLSVIIRNKHGITIPPEVIKGFGDNRLTAKELEYVKMEIPTVEALFSKINFRFKSTNPTGIYNEMWQYMSNKGTFTYLDYIDKEGNPKKKIDKFIPNNPEAYTIIILDHLLLLQKERGFSDKEIIDKASEYMVELRNMFNVSCIFISQFNDGLSSIDRAKFKGVDISPQITDFKSSRNPYADADVVLATMSAFKMDMPTCLGYDINKLKDSFIMLKVIKNRLGRDNIAVGLLANPKAGSFSELPPAKSEDMQVIYDSLL
jgi:replicative DNA helicase